MSQRYNIRLAQAEDSPALLLLINETPQEGNITLNFERQPDFFYATNITTSKPEVWLMEDTHNNKLVASFSIGKRQVYVNGEKKFVRYGNDLRIHQDYKGGRTLFRLFKKYKELMQDDWMQTVILKDNKTSINTVGSGRLSLPTYHNAGQFITHMIGLNKAYSAQSNQVRRATIEDIDEIQAFFDQYAKLKEFYPCYDFNKIGSEDCYYRNLNINDYFLYYNKQELCGVVGTWNQKGFKQTRFLSYHGSMKILRYIINLTSKLFGGLYLPTAGELASYISMHSVLIKDNQEEILKIILMNILYEYKNSPFDALIIGFDQRDPLHKALKGIKSHTLNSYHYLASYGEVPEYLKQQTKQNFPPLFYLEPSRL